MNKSILLPNLFFPDEYKQDVVEITSKAGKIHASIGSKKSLRNPYGFVNFKTQLSMDGSTRTFGLPYLSTLEK